jgi:hypothetical protein
MRSAMRVSSDCMPPVHRAPGTDILPRCRPMLEAMMVLDENLRRDNNRWRLRGDKLTRRGGGDAHGTGGREGSEKWEVRKACGEGLLGRGVGFLFLGWCGAGAVAFGEA